MDSKFTIVIVVLVVLSQFGGFIVSAWKKAQADKESANRRGGLVIVGQDRRTGGNSWEDASTDSVSQAEEVDPDSFWEQNKPQGAEPMSTSVPVSKAPEPTRMQQLNDATPQAPVAAVSQVPAVVMDLQARARIAGRPDLPSRLRRIVGPSTLRQALVAQLVLEPRSRSPRFRP